MTIPASTRRVAVAAVLPVVLRLALLPVLPAPRPEVHDEFSYLLAADTFAHGRLANPAPLLPEFFETFHVLVRPVYMSVYPPAPGAFLAAGQVVLGSPWAGVILSVALMCAAVALALEALLPPRWALAGSLAFALLFGVESYWMNSFWGGAVPALGGGLALAGAARLACPRTRPLHPVLAGAALGAGAGLLLLSRPWEGFWVAGGCAVACLAAVVRRREARAALARGAGTAVLVLGASAAFLFYDDARVTGDPWTPAYALRLRETYTAPIFAWDAGRPPAAYASEELRRFYADWRVSEASIRLSGDARDPVRILWAWGYGFKFLGGAALAAAVLAFGVRGPRTRFLLGIFAGVAAGLSVQRIQQLHYLAPAAALLVALQMQGLRALGTRRLGRRRLSRVLPAVVLAAAFVGLARNVALAARHRGAARGFGERRAELLGRLEAEPGAHLVFVRYGGRHSVHDEWVYNGADLAGAKVLFARDRGADDARLLAAYPGRRAWLLRPDDGDRLQRWRP